MRPARPRRAVARLAATGWTVPGRRQVSAKHYGKRDAAVDAELDRLALIRYAPLELVRETLPPEEYDALFRGAICVQPYRRGGFRRPDPRRAPPPPPTRLPRALSFFTITPPARPLTAISGGGAR